MPYTWYYPSTTMPGSTQDVYMRPVANPLEVIEGSWNESFGLFNAPGSNLYYTAEYIERWRPR